MRPLFLLALVAAWLVPLPAIARRPLLRLPRGTPATGSYIVVLREDTSREAFERLLREAALISEDVPVVTRTVLKTITVKLSAYFLERERHLPEVDHVEEEGMAYGEQVADLPWYLDRLDQPSLPLDYQYQPIGDGEGVDVYIVDSGINYQHYEFQHRAKYAGYDAVDNHYPQRKSQNGSDCHGHGTHVASLAGGVKYGSAKKANLFSVRVLDCNNRAPWSVVLDGLDYAARLIRDRKRPAVVSMSLGGNRQLAANAAVTYLTRLGVPVVVAAGNQGKNACDTSPAGAPTAITVAATCSNDCLYRATNLGSCVDIFAPGCNVEAAGHSCKNCTKVLSGTSMAAPLVAGVVAIHLQRQPFLTPNDILQRLTNSSSKNVICFEGVSNKLSEDTPNKLLQVPGNCGGVYPERTMIAINHPSYPRPYLPLLKCQWKIEAEEGQQVEVDVSFQLERKYDFLLVCDSLNCEFESNDIIGKYTGTLATGAASPRHRSTGRFLSVTFITDTSGSGRGFSANITKYYAGTNVTVPDSGRLIPTAPPPKYPPETRTFLSIPLASVHQLVDGLTRDGFNARWINVYKLPPSTVDFYDLIVCNSTANPTRGFLDLTGEQLSQEIVRQTAAGFSLWTISGRVRVNDTTPLYSVVFGRNPDFIETTALWGMHFLTHISKNSDLLNAGWSIISHTIFSSGAHLSISSVYQRDRRVARNISIPAEDRLPLRQNFYGIDFPQFSQLTLFYNTLRYYPRYVSIYYFGSPRNSQFSVIFEKKQNSTVNFFRWGRNITETTADIELFREHWDPVVVAGYRYKQHTDYFTEWRRRKRR